MQLSLLVGVSTPIYLFRNRLVADEWFLNRVCANNERVQVLEDSNLLLRISVRANTLEDPHRASVSKRGIVISKAYEGLLLTGQRSIHQRGVSDSPGKERAEMIRISRRVTPE